MESLRLAAEASLLTVKDRHTFRPYDEAVKGKKQADAKIACRCLLQMWYLKHQQTPSSRRILRKRWSLPWGISSVNVTKNEGNFVTFPWSIQWRFKKIWDYRNLFQSYLTITQTKVQLNYGAFVTFTDPEILQSMINHFEVIR